MPSQTMLYWKEGDSLVLKELAEHADKEERSVSAQIRFFVKQGLKEVNNEISPNR